MKNDNIPCCAADALRRIRQIPVNGIMTGITMLDESIAAVKEQSPASDAGIREALMKKIKIYNYVPNGAEEGYAVAVLEEYRNSVLKDRHKKI
ncbi:MAG: hypothetical protein M0R30_12475 [Methanoregula sp.]|jgi:hypothetical protein|uniref:hypothetical protein n=1 Tax=Methanoregula sp. TaxID=2052170 RepID=UPI0025F473DD|nr:hypothetical protein [Methanoregula sp.]MCK9632440.1 hypothetical protein [Methanoregula sp.]